MTKYDKLRWGQYRVYLLRYITQLPHRCMYQQHVIPPDDYEKNLIKLQIWPSVWETEWTFGEEEANGGEVGKLGVGGKKNYGRY